MKVYIYLEVLSIGTLTTISFPFVSNGKLLGFWVSQYLRSLGKEMTTIKGFDLKILQFSEKQQKMRTSKKVVTLRTFSNYEDHHKQICPISVILIIKSRYKPSFKSTLVHEKHIADNINSTHIIQQMNKNKKK